MARFGLLLLLLICSAPPTADAQTGTCEPALGEAMLETRQLRARILNNGGLFWRGSPHVYEIPRGGDAHAIFTADLWVGGLVHDSLHIAASRYGPYEFWAGPLDDQGRPPADCSVYDRIWYVSREDVARYERTREATDDLADWPTGLGAPTVDANGDPVDLLDQPLAQRADRTINLAAGERPAILGDVMAWWVMNDLGNVHLVTSNIQRPTESYPLGMEVHSTAFAFDANGPLGTTTFYRYRFHYRGVTEAIIQTGGTYANRMEKTVTLQRGPLEQAYVGFFFDADLGNFDDDYIGSDPELGLGYVYNSDNDDSGHQGYGIAPPAIGGDFVRGPTNDYGITHADFDFGQVAFFPDLRNNRLPMTSFIFYYGGGCVVCDPSIGWDYYNYMRAHWKDGKPMTYGGNARDFSNIPTRFFFPGDPTQGAFWTELNADNQGTAIDPADRRHAMSSGPFRMEVGEVDTIDFAIIWARGDDHLDSVTQLKRADRAIQAFVDDGYRFPAAPAAPTLSATSLSEGVLLQWDNPATSNNHFDAYTLQTDLLSLRADDAPYQFEGYDVFLFESADDSVGTRIATYDRANGVTRVIEGYELTYVSATGRDSGIQHHHLLTGLTPYRTYHVGVQPYGYSPDYRPHVYRGPIARMTVVPTPAEASAFTAPPQAALGQTVRVTSASPIDAVRVAVLDPQAITGDSYLLTTYVLADASPAYDLFNETTGTDLFDGRAFAEQASRPPPFGPEPLVRDGLQILVDASVPSDASYRFETAGLEPTMDLAAGLASLVQIGIAPNPYKALSAYETQPKRSEVRFTNLPEQVTLRVYSLNGTLVKTLEKNDLSAWFAWDLQTDEGRDLGSGVYLIYVEVPGIGTRVMKFAVVR